ncbi:RHS repeat-associated core domain-containing protein, partial [Pseudomonas amygdali pv. tabaci]
IHRRYEYDPAGELSRTLDKLRGETQYEYEANGQLLARNTGRVVDGEEFRYDAAANRLNFNTSRFDHVKDNRLRQWANHEYKYDAWGNLIEKVVGIVRWQTFTYDCENRLVKTETMADTQVESTSSYQYDSLGRRVAKQSDIKGHTDHKRFLWQGLRMLREESPGQSSLYIYEPGSYAPLARVDEKEGEVENKVYYFHTDQIGTPLEMTDAEGQIVWQAKYRAWGAVEKLVVNEVEQNLRFQGQYFDVETGLHYNTFRYYDPEIGRFITQDPIGLDGGYNLYQYNLNPIRWIDVTGLAGCTLIKADAVDHDYLLRLKRSEYPETFGHIQDAINGGQPYIVTIQRDAAKLNRKTSLKDVKTMKLKDRDEWPMAMFNEGGSGASVRHIGPSDNRGAGSSIGNVLSGPPNGTKIKVEVF